MFKVPLLFLLLIVLVPLDSYAQAPAVQVVQQPVVRHFSLGTSVSVPDGGRAYLGGVSRSATGRKSSGLLRTGTSSGFEMSNASQSASVTVLDFEAMDQALLESGERIAAARAANKRQIHPRAELAWQALQARQKKQR